MNYETTMHEFASFIWGTLEMKVEEIAQENPKDLRERILFLAHEAKDTLEKFGENFGFYPCKEAEQRFQEMVDQLMRNVEEYQAQYVH